MNEKLTKAPINIFVLGDLVHDHAIFVERKTAPHQPVAQEGVYVVQSRLDTAGGAANCARILAATSYGKTFLWGITGRSLWRDFPTILLDCHNLDAADQPIRFRGLYDPAIPMNTITRIVLRERDGHTHVARYDDVGHSSISRARALRAVEHVLENNEEQDIHAIIVNDLDMNSLSRELCEELAEFAQSKGIGIFVDPKRNFSKYAGIRGTAILPNLKEWCHIIGEPENDMAWRKKLVEEDGLIRRARRSLTVMPNFVHHVIKCDRDGVILITPGPQSLNRYLVYLLAPHPTDVPDDQLNPQLGYGDVMAGILALQYASSNKQSHPGERMHAALRIANRVVACYRQMPYHRLPNRNQIERLRSALPAAVTPRPLEAGMIHLPTAERIILNEHRTAISGLISVDPDFRSEIEKLVKFFQSGWDVEDARSAILSARGGSGKTEIMKGLDRVLGDRFSVVNMEAYAKLVQKNAAPPLDAYIDKVWEDVGNGYDGLVCVFDEAFKRAINILKNTAGVSSLEDGHAKKVRFLFIDADLEKYRAQLSESQFMTRCDEFMLPALRDRPWDICHIFAAMLGQHLKPRSVLSVQGDALVALVDWLMRNPSECSPRKLLVDAVKPMQSRVLKNCGDEDFVQVLGNDFPDEVREHLTADGVNKSFEFVMPGD